jgi:hypothetical protein
MRLQDEGISTIDDLAAFDEDAWKQVSYNFNKPGGMVPNPAVAGEMMPQPPVIFGAKSQQRLKVASELVIESLTASSACIFPQ